jgi:hypothetical protein
MRQGSEARIQAAGVEEEEEVVVVEAIVSVDMERGLDMAAARGFKGEKTTGIEERERGSSRGREGEQEFTRIDTGFNFIASLYLA